MFQLSVGMSMCNANCLLDEAKQTLTPVSRLPLNRLDHTLLEPKLSWMQLDAPLVLFRSLLWLPTTGCVSSKNSFT